MNNSKNPFFYVHTTQLQCALCESKWNSALLHNKGKYITNFIWFWPLCNCDLIIGLCNIHYFAF